MSFRQCFSYKVAEYRTVFLASDTTCRAAVLRQPCPKLGLALGADCVGADAYDPEAVSRPRPCFSILVEEIDSPRRPVHPSVTVCKNLSGTADAFLKAFEDVVEANCISEAAGITPVTSNP